MGRIKNFFKKIGQGIKNGATKVYNFGKGVVQKVGHVLRPVADIAEKVGGVMSALPGKAGMIGSGLAAGGATVKTITDLLPESKAKTKLNEALDKTLNKGQEYINKGAGIINDINNKTQPWLKAGTDISRKIADGADKLGAKMPANLPVIKTPYANGLSTHIGGDAFGKGGPGFTPISGVNPWLKMSPEQRAAYRQAARNGPYGFLVK